MSMFPIKWFNQVVIKCTSLKPLDCHISTTPRCVVWGAFGPKTQLVRVVKANQSSGVFVYKGLDWKNLIGIWCFWVFGFCVGLCECSNQVVLKTEAAKV